MRMIAVILAAGGIAALGYVVTLMPARNDHGTDRLGEAMRIESPFKTLASVASEGADPAGKEAEFVSGNAGDADAKMRLTEVRKMIEAGEHERAMNTLNEIRRDVQKLPDAYFLMGLALFGKSDFETARDFFHAAIERAPGWDEPYFGYAMAAEELGDLEDAIGGMRSFLHMQKNPDPFRLRVAQARSAIWEWESKLGRGEWGASRGIPPGFTEDELKRDGRGTAAKMPVPGTEDKNGATRYIVKHSDRIKMFER